MNEYQEIITRLKTDRSYRKELCRQSFKWFFLTYFTHYIQYELAPFHHEFFKLLETDEKLVVIVAFRGSAKSTIVSLAYVIWAIVGRMKKRYPVLFSLNQQRAHQLLFNIRQEFEKNDLLRSDFGPFGKDSDEWSYNSLLLSPYGARITTLSSGEGFRGLRERQYRPDLIIGDDIEDVSSTKTKESRDKLWQTINGELIPAGDLDTKIVFIGNLVHEDSAMMRLKKLVLSGKLKGEYREYPLYDANKQALWKDKFPTWNDIKKLEATIPSYTDFQREYLINIIPEGDRVVFPEWLHYYDPTMPFAGKDFQCFLISIDPAVSERSSADKTAILIVRIYGYGKDTKIYILPHPTNKRMSWPDLVKEVKLLKDSLGAHATVKIITEGGGQQKGLAQILQAEGLPVEEIIIQGQDKRTRLAMASNWIKNGNILFPNTGSEELVNQILYFGTERYDDLVDSFSLMVSEVLGKPDKGAGFREYMKSVVEKIKMLPFPEQSVLNLLSQYGFKGMI
jgi:predicted phage terminase large subunit-like protein